MTKEVKISVCGVQYLDGEAQEPVRTVAAGTYYKKKDRYYLLYDTTEAETGAVTKNRIRISGDCVEMTRSGSARVHMSFRPGARRRAEYMTSAGMFLMDTVTHAVRVTEMEDRIEIRLEYALESDGMQLAENHLEIIACSLS
ncbi:MAG: DUF1934 domain-containing protein [Lachnospiraceae bacterium]|nr:DUF1934 domain-containing protein [Lachnospiraceae bacterium]